jgi:hypothetical protein
LEVRRDKGKGEKEYRISNKEFRMMKLETLDTCPLPPQSGRGKLLHAGIRERWDFETLE